MGAFSAFIVALFTEMYGIPLTLYLLSGWLGSTFPALGISHAGGHVWNDLTGWRGDAHLSPFHLVSYAFIGGGFWLIAAAWHVLHQAAGPYSWVRHPQYDGFLLITIGFLLQWPTIPTLVMFPVLVFVYARLRAPKNARSQSALATSGVPTPSARRDSFPTADDPEPEPHRVTSNGMANAHVHRPHST